MICHEENILTVYYDDKLKDEWKIKIAKRVLDYFLLSWDDVTWKDNVLSFIHGDLDHEVNIVFPSTQSIINDIEILADEPILVFKVYKEVQEAVWELQGYRHLKVEV
jgi:hypothetical protein